MDNEKKISERVEQYRDLAKGNKQIDVVALMTSALAQSRIEEVAAKRKRWAYLLSVAVPPLGLVPSVYYYFSGKSDGKRVALTCAILTLIAVLVDWMILSLVMSGLGPNEGGLQGADLNINLQDLRGLLQ